MFVNVKLRVTSRRKVAFFWLDSIRVTSISGAQIFIGRPGKPAPEPMSIRRVLAEPCSGGRTGASAATFDRIGKRLPGCEQGFAEVAGYDFFRLADGGEVDAGVPAEE